MGEIVTRLCDLAVVTSDNPRTEDPGAIIAQILEGARKANNREYSAADLENGFKDKGYVVEADRRRAIQLGIRVSEAGDTVLIAGKGHETYQILKDGKIPFDDREVARRIIKQLGYRRGARNGGRLNSTRRP